MNFTFGAAHFVKWLFAQDEAWLSSDGKWYVLTPGHENTMHSHHIVNTLLMLERTSLDIHRSMRGVALEGTSSKNERDVAASWVVNSKLYKGMKTTVLAALDG